MTASPLRFRDGIELIEFVFDGLDADGLDVELPAELVAAALLAELR